MLVMGSPLFEVLLVFAWRLPFEFLVTVSLVTLGVVGAGGGGEAFAALINSSKAALALWAFSSLQKLS
jgi:hypothetical protein